MYQLLPSPNLLDISKLLLLSGLKRLHTHTHIHFSLAVRLFWCRHAVLIESHPFCTTLNLQLSFCHPLCYNSRAHCPLLQCIHTSAILAGAYSYFLVPTFKCEGKNSCHCLITYPRIYYIHNEFSHFDWQVWFKNNLNHSIIYFSQ